MKLNIVFRTILVIILIFLNIKIFANEGKDINYNYNYSELYDKCQVYDPYQSLNRKIFQFNRNLDTFILRPIAKGYARFTNDYTKNRVESFVDNIKVPLTTANYGIQGNIDGIFKSFWRFAINSTFGVVGLFDIASKFDLNPEAQTFGNTLTHYGVGPGPYIVLPIYGGMSARDIIDPLFTNSFLNLAQWPMNNNLKLSITAARTIHYREKIMPFTDYVTKHSPDPYIAIRDATLTQREAKILYPSGFKCPKT